MRTITMRQFARNLKKELSELPVTVTKNDEPVIVVSGYKEYLRLDTKVPSYIKDASQPTSRTI